MEIVENIMALNDKTITFKDETHFSELFMTLKELVMSAQNFVMSSNLDLSSILSMTRMQSAQRKKGKSGMTHPDGSENFLINTLEHFLKTFDVTLDNPGQAIQLIR